MLKPHTRAEVSFEFIREIGHEGKNSQAHVARDHHLDAELVIKTVTKSKIGDPAEYFAEARTLYLSSHPNVVPIHYACEDNDAIHIAMPYYPKGSLNALMAQKFLTVREIIRYAAQFLSGLHNIHSKRLIHFDVKPDNILLSDRDEALLSDFGLAKQTNYSGVAGQDRIYLKMAPPEVYSTPEFDLRFDIYQVGLTLYRMANGNKRFYDQFDNYGPSSTFDRHRFRTSVLNEQFPKRKEFLEHIPNKLRDVITKCLKSDPSQRYSSVIQIINDLADIGGNDLDWRYEEDASRGRTWVKKADAVEYRLDQGLDGSCEAKKRNHDGQYRRITEYCKTSPTTQDIRRFLTVYPKSVDLPIMEA